MYMQLVTEYDATNIQGTQPWKIMIKMGKVDTWFVTGCFAVVVSSVSGHAFVSFTDTDCGCLTGMGAIVQHDMLPHAA